MMSDKTYSERVKKLITDLYLPCSPGAQDLKMTTNSIYSDLCTIIPSTAFDPYEVVEIMEDLGFVPGYEQKEEITFRTIEGETDEKGNPLVEKDIKTYDDLVYYWYLKKKL